MDVYISSCSISVTNIQSWLYTLELFKKREVENDKALLLKKWTMESPIYPITVRITLKLQVSKGLILINRWKQKWIVHTLGNYLAFFFLSWSANGMVIIVATFLDTQNKWGW